MKQKEKDRERQLSHESLEDTSSIVRYLHALAEGFESGALKFSAEDTELTLKPSGLVHFEVNASKKRDRLRIALRFTWKDGRGDDTRRPKKLSIRAEE